MNFFDHDPKSGGLVMVCQVCGGKCHSNGPVKVWKKNDAGMHQQFECKLCICSDCCQLADDPIRRQLAGMMLGQTREQPFNIGRAMQTVAQGLGLQPVPDRPKLETNVACGCGDRAKTQCLDCDDLLCGKCVRTHACRGKNPGKV
jgi:hypothetical protein